MNPDEEALEMEKRKELERFADSNDSNDSNQKNQKNQRITNYKEFLLECSIPEKVAFYYLDEGPLTDDELAERIGTTRDIVRNSGRNRNRLPGVYKASNDRPAKYCIHREDAVEPLKKFETYLRELQMREARARDLEAKQLIPQDWREYLTQDRGGTTLVDEAAGAYLKSGGAVFYLDVGDVQHYNPDLAAHLVEEPQEAQRLVRSMVEQEYAQRYGSDRAVSWDVEIRGNRDRAKIARIRAANAGQLVTFDVEVIAKGELYDKARTSRYECTSCGVITPIVQKLESPVRKELRKCLKCGKKNPRLLDEEVATVQDVTVQDVAESLLPSEQPRTLPCILVGGVAERTAERLNVTDKILLTGCYIREEVLRKPDFRRVLLVLGIERLSEGDLQAVTTPESRAEVERIRSSNDPLREVAQITFAHLDGLSFSKEVCALQPFSRTNLLLLGESGLGKTELSKGIAAAFPRTEFFQSSFSSKVGLTATVWKDQHTGRFVMGQNGLVRLSPHGTAIIDEIEKADEEVHHSLLGVMEDRLLRVRKATIQQDLPCDVQIVGTANPRGGRFSGYDDPRTDVDLPPALLDRFGIVLLFVREHRSLDVRTLLGLRKKKIEGIRSEQRLGLRDLWLTGWQTRVELDEAALDKVETLLRATVMQHPEVYGDSMRAIELVPSILEALCRLTADAAPKSYHFQKVEELLRGVEENHKAAKRALNARLPGVR